MKLDLDDMPTMISFDEDTLPEIKNWKVGGKYTLQIDVEQKSVSKDMRPGDKKDSLLARFEVKSVTPVKKSAGTYSKDIVEKAIKK